MPSRIYIVEDHPVFREGMLALIGRAPGLEVCGFGESSAEAVEAAQKESPDLILVDLDLGSESGLDVIRQIRSMRPKQRILAMSGLDESLYAVRAIRAGASGYLMKSETTSALIDGIRAILSGRMYLSQHLAQRLLSIRLGHEEEGDDPLGMLTDRELEVYRLIGAGGSVREIAEKLYLSPKTIETYRANIKHKLGLRSSRDLLRHATAWRLDQIRTRTRRPQKGEVEEVN